MVRQDTLCTLRDGNSGIKAFSDLPDGTFQKNHCRLGNDYGKRLLHNTDFCSVIINKERYGHRESETEPGRGSGGKQWRQAARIFKKENIPKTAETVGRDTFEEWMGRIMERFDRQDRIISVLVNKDAAGVKYLDGERLYDNQDLCEMLRTSKRSLQRFRSKYRLRYQRIGHKTYYKESDVLEFISQNMEEVLQGGTKVLRMKEQPGMEAPKNKSGKRPGHKKYSPKK